LDIEKEGSHMRAKWLRAASLAALLGLVAVVPASTQILSGSAGSDGEADLRLLVLINRMELTSEQMRQVHDLLAGLLEERDALDVLRADLEQEMIAFSGTAEELDQILETYRAEAETNAEAVQASVADAIDQIKGILTFKQGEILEEFLPGLMDAVGGMARLGRRSSQESGAEAGSSDQDEASDSRLGLRERLLDQLRERLPKAEIVERLEQRLGRFAPDGAVVGAIEREAARASVVVRVGGRSMSVQLAGGAMARRFEWIERLVRVLELKLEAIG